MMLRQIKSLTGLNLGDRNFVQPAFRKAINITFLALFGAEVLTFVYYQYIVRSTWDYVLLNLLLTGIITVVVAFPIAVYLSVQRLKLNSLSVQLARMASVDQMSGLLNRTSLIEAIRHRIAHPVTADGRGAFLYIDADHFKALNDDFGHAAGDEAIAYIGKVISQNIRETDLAGRLGGEEFGVYLNGGNEELAKTVSENIRQDVMHLKFDNKKQRYTLTVSIGIATHAAGEKPSVFMKIADRNLYLAKSNGRNCIAA
ncbi:GGDEF domain-containing protein [Maritalea mediterranea]|uniref:diguanylate cyclase n=1 Tax=Maritalea mediterranea TaxID=2909667 RepID=A0ABS9E6L9_9HYPH|nr:GGDEF domain-containing protein [Maritalea mediterranea]MCF4097425.1 GGDEF domain-containing protein [Maritalea mediterranea]